LVVLVCLCLSLGAASVLAADGAGGGPAGPGVVTPPTPPAPTPRPAAGQAGAADDAAANGTSEDDLAKLLREMSPEDVHKLIRSAIESRLKVERQQAAGEMNEDLLADPTDLKAALAILNDGPKNTQKDNIDRILRAFAKVDPRIAKAMKLMDEKKPAEAVATIEKDLNAQEATYRNAARYMLQARALAAAGKKYEAAEAYQKILVDMGDRISFAASAAMESAAIYEELSRFTYAAQMYAFALNNFGVTLDEEALKLIDKKATEYGAFGKDPLGWAGGVMSEVRKRLDKNDSGKETQEKEQKIVAVITDLIKTAEEQQQQGQGQGQSQQRQKGKKPGEGEGEGQGEGQGQGKSKGPPKGNQNPSSPAQTSALVPGAVARPTKRDEVHNGPESGDWATLPPREKQKLEELRKKVMSERYRDIISKYRTKISETGGNE
jgi:tetratricopeptide (TPR) repeat protein